jgi:hypothetical protein
MRRRIPTRTGQIKTTDESKRVVNHNDFLMMTRTDRVPSIHQKMQTLVRAPAKMIGRQPLALHGIEHGEIPVQHVSVQFSTLGNDRMQEIAQWLGIAIRGPFGHQPYTAVYIPRQNKNAPSGLSNRCSHSSKIDLCIKKHGKMMRVCDAPAIVAGLEKRDCYAAGRIHI